MAIETGCLTSGAIFHTSIQEKSVAVTVDLPFRLEISEEEALEETGASEEGRSCGPDEDPSQQ